MREEESISIDTGSGQTLAPEESGPTNPILKAIEESKRVPYDVHVRVPESQFEAAVRSAEQEARRAGLLVLKSYEPGGVHLVAVALGQPAEWRLTIDKIPASKWPQGSL